MIEYILFVVGIVLLIKGADLLVEGSSSLAKKFGVSTLIIGLTVVAFGTSMPELVVNVFSAIKGNTDIALGNIIGSNLSNILLVLGLTAIIYPIRVQHSTTWKEIPFALLGVVALFIICNDLIFDKASTSLLSRIDGIVLLLFFIIFIYYVIESTKKNKSQLKDEKIEIKKHKGHIILLMIFGGLVGLFLGGKWVVDGAIVIARNLGLSEFMISATIVAIGTSLPELVTSVVAALKKDIDLAVGNIVGSNIFNIFWILGVTSIIAPIYVPSFVNIDLLILIIVSFLLFLFMFIGQKHKLERWQGILFVLMYIAYIAFLIIRG